MDVFLYAIIFVTGAFFGSFFTLAVYRIPRKEDIFIKHSYCPNCNHKLGFFDLFPILSYLFLRGKCRYCGQKIRPRYLIIELLAGLTFLMTAFSLKITFSNLLDLINMVVILMYISVLFVIAGIDKENLKIQKGPLIVGYLIEGVYIIYQCIVGIPNVYQYVIYLILLILLLLLSNLNLRANMTDKYSIQTLFLSLYMIIFNGSKTYILTVILTLISIAIYKILSKQKNKELPIGFYLCVNHILVMILSNLFVNYMI